MDKYFEELTDKFNRLSDAEFDELLKASGINNCPNVEFLRIACEKQVPKEAIEKEGRHSFSGKLMYVIARCPSCRSEINSSTNAYCNSCGQLIDVAKWFDGIPDII